MARPLSRERSRWKGGRRSAAPGNERTGRGAEGPPPPSASSCQRSPPAEAPLQDRLLGVEPVLGLVEDRRAGPVDDLARHLLPAVRGETVQEDGLGLGQREEGCV